MGARVSPTAASQVTHYHSGVEKFLNVKLTLFPRLKCQSVRIYDRPIYLNMENETQNVKIAARNVQAVIPSKSEAATQPPHPTAIGFSDFTH